MLVFQIQKTQAGGLVKQDNCTQLHYQWQSHWRVGRLQTHGRRYIVRSAAIWGEFVSLADFIGNNDSPYLDVILEHNDRPVKNKRAVDNFDNWLSAWSKYEALLVQHHPSIYPNVAPYRRLIQKCNHKYVWQAVYC